MSTSKPLETLPEVFQASLWERCQATTPFAILEAALDGRLRQAQGALGHFELGELKPGVMLVEALPFLAGLLPHEGGPLRMPALKVAGGRKVDVELRATPVAQWIILYDVSRAIAERADLLQTINEQALALERAERVLRAVAATEVAIFERLTPSRFRLLGQAPSWLRPLAGPEDNPELDLAALSSFLETFLYDAERHWEGPPGPRLRSTQWRESFPGVGELDLVASALVLPGAGGRVLLLEPATIEEYSEQVLQLARDLGYQHEAMLAQLEQKEVLLHCIVHDLGSPLAGMAAALSGLETAPESQRAALLQIGLRQADRQSSLIRQILEVFRADHEGGGPGQEHVDLAAVLHSAADSVATSYGQLDVELLRSIKDGDARVRGDRLRIERMVVNLLENALRYSPRRSQVELSLARGSEHWIVAVADRGPGVPDAAQATLFQKLQQGPHKTGRLGLGLYFCRITAEALGGRATFHPRAGGGSIFSLELPAET